VRGFLWKASLLGIVVFSLYVVLGGFIDGDNIMRDQRFKMKKMKKGESYPTIILGDSKALAMNVWPHQGVYNYALTYFDGFYPYRYVLNEYLRHNRPPDAIILSVSPRMFLEPNWFGVRRTVANLLPFSDYFRTRRVRDIAGLMYDRFDVSNSLAVQLHRRLAAPDELYDPRTGALLFSRNSVFTPERWPEGVAFIPTTFVETPRAKEQLEGFFADAKAARSRVMMYFMPTPAVIYRERPAFFQGFENNMRTWAARFPDVIFWPPYGALDVWPENRFVDGSHLNEAGARAFETERFPELLALLRAQSPTH
jgi:hypothetical protein